MGDYLGQTIHTFVYIGAATFIHGCLPGSGHYRNNIELSRAQNPRHVYGTCLTIRQEYNTRQSWQCIQTSLINNGVCPSAGATEMIASGCSVDIMDLQ